MTEGIGSEIRLFLNPNSVTYFLHEFLYPGILCTMGIIMDEYGGLVLKNHLPSC